MAVTTAAPSFAMVTGTSSGIGLAVAEDLLGRGWRVIGAARRAAPLAHPQYTHLRLDLADLPAVLRTLENTVQPILADPRVARVGLVNNAALVALLGTIVKLDPIALAQVFAVNTQAPIALMGWFVRQVRAKVPLRIVNVSTGAAVQPIPGLGAYGSSKAALRLAGMILAGELDAAAAGGTSQPDASVLSYEPGLVDTPMQAAARKSSAETLPVQPMFQEWAATGALVPAEGPAHEIAEYLASDGHPRWLERRFQGDPTAR